ncbi:hypothetical protein CIK05_04475 [Bdellovibrio sp. qaytius]|nr:hypothetical protein CIK05_04475 [Bdellovibrio sp. qaytius]
MKKIILILITLVASLTYAQTAKVKDANAQYPTVAMKASYIQKDMESKRKYMNAQEREVYRVVIKSGIVYGIDGKIYPDTINNTPEHINLVKYVMDAHGNLYVWDGYKNTQIRHSGIFAGGPVAGGGEISIKDGRIIQINADSGHYPTAELLKNVLRELQNEGVDINGITH